MKKILITALTIILAFPCILILNIGIICTELENTMNTFSPKHTGERKNK